MPECELIAQSEVIDAECFSSPAAQNNGTSAFLAAADEWKMSESALSLCPCRCLGVNFRGRWGLALGALGLLIAPLTQLGSSA